MEYFIYYVVEAVPESKNKKLWVITAFKTREGGVTQRSDAINPEKTPEASSASLPPHNSISKGANGSQEAIQKQLRKMDTEYLELAKDPEKNEAKLSKMVEEAAREAGSYWFSANKYHANASYRHYPGGYPAAENPMTYSVYLKLGKTADIGNGRVEAITYDDRTHSEVPSRDFRRVAVANTDDSLSPYARRVRERENATKLFDIAKEIYASLS